MAKNPYQGDDVDPFSGARDEEGGIKRESPKKMSFGQAFAAARKAGDKTFEFKGKKYTTEMAKPKAKPAEKGPDKATLDRIDRKAKEESKGPSDAELDRMAKKFDTKKDRPGSEVIAEKQEKAQPKMQGAYREAFGNIKKALGFKSGGSVSASKRADGCAKRGRTKCKMV
jgi:hypothetical protein